MLHQVDGAVFVRMDETHAQLWRVLITGPKDTPYENGCFLFDVTFSPDYPLDPPKVQVSVEYAIR